MRYLLVLMLFVIGPAVADAPLVLQSDFGEKDSAVASMKGVAVSVASDIQIFDLTHEIPAYNIWEASIRLIQTAEYWPKGTVFVSVVDPGVGTSRKSVVLKTKSGHYFVTPDNGTLTFVAQELGVEELREIDETVNRLENSEKSFTFHGRDVYAYTGARLASGVIAFEEVGGILPRKVVSIPYQSAYYEKGVVMGNIPILDVQYGNVWTNIDRDTLHELGLQLGHQVRVRVRHSEKLVLDITVPYVKTFGAVEVGKPLLYLNSINSVSLAINQGNFAAVHHIDSGPEWSVLITKN